VEGGGAVIRDTGIRDTVLGGGWRGYVIRDAGICDAGIRDTGIRIRC
jgi:hypothetical protein